MRDRDDSLMGKKPSMDQKIRLYELMGEVFNTRPWEYLYDDQVFGIKIPKRNENAYICVLGNSGLDYTICAFLGQAGLDGFYEIRDNFPDSSNENPDLYFELAALTCPRLHATFIPYSLMEKEDLALIRKLKLKFGEKIGYPAFHSYLPGFQPVQINSEEAEIMIDALEQLIELYPDMISENSDERFFYDDPDKMLLRVPYLENGKKVWKDERFSDDAEPEIGDERYLYSDIQLHQYRKKGKTINDLEYAFFLLPAIIEETERPHMVFVSIFLDSDTGNALSQEILAPLPNYYAMLERMPSVILKQLMALDGIPEKIWVEHELAYEFLSSLESVGIEIAFIEELDWFPDFYQKMLSLMH